MRQMESDLASTLAKARKIYASLHPAVFIAQSASGASACDLAIRIGTHLCAAIVAMRDLTDSPLCQFPATPQSRSAAADARHVLRDRAGEPPLPSCCGSRLQPLSWREHELFGDDLKAVQRGLAELESACWNVAPAARRHVRDATRSLGTLQARFEAAARRDYPDGQDGRSVATLYFGDRYIPRWRVADAVQA